MALPRILIINIFLLLMLLLGKYVEYSNEFISSVKYEKCVGDRHLKPHPFLFSFCRPYFIFLVTNNRSSLNACSLH
jgi:hypothetical protein